jgi:dihydroorotate dehydrogenase
MNLYPLLRPLVMALDAEAAHRLAIWALKRRRPREPAPDDPILATRVFGLDFPNPVGIAAGFDKHGEVPLQLAALGFGFVEIGSVTPRPQPGNARPRVFRLAQDRAVINRYGFNSVGAAHARGNLQYQLVRAPGLWRRVVIGANLGKNKNTPADRAADDFAEVASALNGFSRYLVVNVSSPNTPGLRALQGRAELSAILAGVRRVLADPLAGHKWGGVLLTDEQLAERRKQLAEAPSPPLRQHPLLVKIAPDLGEDDLADIASVALAGECDGLIVSNTTIRRPETLKSRRRGEAGGLSGAPLKPFALETLRKMYRRTEGRVPLIGVGGIASGVDAYERMRAGAALVQIYTALVYEGPALVERIKRELAALLRRDGFAAVAEAVGADHRRT